MGSGKLFAPDTVTPYSFFDCPCFRSSKQELKQINFAWHLFLAAGGKTNNPEALF
jgi:hypothetical protein